VFILNAGLIDFDTSDGKNTFFWREEVCICRRVRKEEPIVSISGWARQRGEYTDQNTTEVTKVINPIIIMSLVAY